MPMQPGGGLYVGGEDTRVTLSNVSLRTARQPTAERWR